MRNELADLELYCNEIISQTAGKLSWQWDGQIGAMLAVFDKSGAKEMYQIMHDFFSAAWNSQSVSEAPDSVQDIADNLGGIRQGQYIFTSQPDETAMVYAAWWPWGDGQTISLRISLKLGSVSNYDQAMFMEEFKGWFLGEN